MDKLSIAYMELCNMQNIDDLANYARAWLELAQMADAEGRPALAAMCISRGDYYSQVAAEQDGEYIRLLELPFAELIPVVPRELTADEVEWIRG